MQLTPDQHERISKTNPLLDATIYSKDKSLRSAQFEAAWSSRWSSPDNKQGVFQSAESESPFAQYSSRGWKVHIVFEKGREKEVAQFLFTNGLYFKVESQVGTYFNGNKSSGSTIYIGSHDNMKAITEEVEKGLGRYLVEGGVARFADGRTVAMGSGSDIQLKPKITARF